MNIITESLSTFISATVLFISAFLPKLLAGFLILFIGIIIASLLRDFLKIIFRYISLEKWLSTAGIAKSTDASVWPNLLGEMVRWITIFIFLISAVEVWGIPKVGDVLQQLLSFLPSVFIVVIIGWVGLIAARFAHDIVRHGVRGLGSQEALVLGNAARYTIVFFTVLIILTQLGVATELIKILFTGIVGMLALAFGLAFGLGGRDQASKLLDKLMNKLDETGDSKGKKYPVHDSKLHP